MRPLMIAPLFAAILALPLHAQEGDIAEGESQFRKCRACHMIQDDQGQDIVRGGRGGPNLWNIVGRKIASEPGYRYGDAILQLAEAQPDMVWTEAELTDYITDPNAWLQKQTGDDRARSKMTFRMRDSQADLAAYLASVSPGAATDTAPEAAQPE